MNPKLRLAGVAALGLGLVVGGGVWWQGKQARAAQLFDRALKAAQSGARAGSAGAESCKAARPPLESALADGVDAAREETLALSPAVGYLRSIWMNSDRIVLSSSGSPVLVYDAAPDPGAIRSQFRLQPGTYQVTYRSRNARRTELTLIKDITIESGRSATINF